MGHARLGDFPTSKKWREVLRLLRVGADVGAVAAAITANIESELDRSASDPAVVRSFLLLTRVVRAAASDDFLRGLEEAGISAGSSPDGTALVAAFSEALDRRRPGDLKVTDLGEAARLAAVSALASAISSFTPDFFAQPTEQLQHAIRRVDDDAAFGRLIRDFFGRTTDRVLSDIVARGVGATLDRDGGIRSMADVARFEEALSRHCSEVAFVVEDFAGGWYGKTIREGEFSYERARGFVGYALFKLQRELRERAES